MPVDTSFYPKANPPVDPMTQVGNMMNVVGQMNQNKLFQQTNAAKLALGQAYRDATNPLTGELDEAKLMTIITQDGNPASFLAPDVRAQAMANRQAKLTYQTGQFELFKKQYDQGNAILSSLPKNAGPEDALKAINNAVSNGQVPYEMGVGWAADLLKDPSKFPDWLQQRRLQTMDAKTRADMLYGTVQQINTGPTTELLAVSPMTGAQQLGSVQMGMSPSDAATPVTSAVDPATGRETLVTKGQLAGGGRGSRLTIPPGAPGSGGSGLPGAPGAGGGGYVTKLGPGEEAALRKTGETSADDYDRDSKVAQQYAQQKFQFREIIDLAGKTNTGQGTEWRNALNSFALTAGSALGLDDSAYLQKITDADDNKYYEELNKLLTRNALEYSLRFGQGGDKLSAAAMANPSVKMRGATIQDLTRINYSMLKNHQAMVSAFNASGAGPQEYRKFAVKWNTESDPRAFLYDMLPADRQQKLYASLKGKDKIRFGNTLKMAEDYGFLE